jgi:glycosyltransferase involved in cell wall biosynthesis
VGTNDWAIAKYQNYVRELGRYSVYFNPTVRSPMPRARGEAMMAGLVSVSLRNHDVDLFIKNGVNGFYADSSEELAEQIYWLSERPSARKKIALASRNTAMDIFNQDRYLSSWSQLLNEIAAGKGN